MSKSFRYSNPGTTANNICDQSRTHMMSHWCLRGSCLWFKQRPIHGKGVVKKWEKTTFGSGPDSYLYWNCGRKKLKFSKNTTWENTHCFLQSSLLSYGVVQFAYERNSHHIQAAALQVSKRVQISIIMLPVKCCGEGSEWPHCPVSALQDLLEQGVPCLLLQVLKSAESPSGLQVTVNHSPFSILNHKKTTSVWRSYLQACSVQEVPRSPVLSDESHRPAPTIREEAPAHSWWQPWPK